MLKLIKIFRKPLFEKKIMPWRNKIVSRCVYDINFDSEEEIMKNVLGKVMTIGINLPDTKNVLTKTALQKLCDCIENFESNGEISVAVLHGRGGNFCTGIILDKDTLLLSESLLKKLEELKKPIIGSLNGYVTNFGAYLAIMCDMRIMDSTGVVGFNYKVEDLEAPSFVYERLILTVGLSNTLEIMCSKKMMKAEECLKTGFLSKSADLGCALGQSILLAQSIAFHRPLKSIIKNKSKVYSFLTTKST